MLLSHPQLAWTFLFCVPVPSANFLLLQLHQNTMANEEFEALREVREARAAGNAPAHAVCLMAVAASSDVPDASPLLRIGASPSNSSSNSNGSSRAQFGSGGEKVVGSLDLCNVRAIAGEVLIGESCSISVGLPGIPQLPMSIASAAVQVDSALALSLLQATAATLRTWRMFVWRKQHGGAAWASRSYSMRANRRSRGASFHLI